MAAGELIKLIPQKTFQDLAIETKVDAQVKQLTGAYNHAVSPI